MTFMSVQAHRNQFKSINLNEDYRQIHSQLSSMMKISTESKVLMNGSLFRISFYSTMKRVTMYSLRDLTYRVSERKEK